MWVRGLKQEPETIDNNFLVAPYVGAWIETSSCAAARYDSKVAPYVGAWIETMNGMKN